MNDIDSYSSSQSLLIMKTADCHENKVSTASKLNVNNKHFLTQNIIILFLVILG